MDRNQPAYRTMRPRFHTRRGCRLCAGAVCAVLLAVAVLHVTRHRRSKQPTAPAARTETPAPVPEYFDVWDDYSYALQQTRCFGEYEIRLWSASGHIGIGRLTVLQHGRPVYDRTHGALDFQTEPGVDVTGDGEPNFSVFEWTGGAHCCGALYVFALGEQFRPLQAFDVRDCDYIDFENMDEEPAYELGYADFTTRYSDLFAGRGVFPHIVLRRRGDDYVLAPDLMRRPPPARAKLEALAAQTRAEGAPPGDPPWEFWDTLVDLLYTGNCDVAEAFLEEVWPERDGREKALRQMRAELSSAHLEELRAAYPDCAVLHGESE